MTRYRDARGRFTRTRPIRSNPETVNRILDELATRERRRPDLSPLRARRYRPGPYTHTANHPAQGGLPSLGKGY